MIKNKRERKIALLVIIALSLFNAYAQSEEPKAAVQNFHYGFINKNAQRVTSSSGNTLLMFNGNFSDDPLQWQPHMSLEDEEIEEWATWMIENAGPHSNELEFISSKQRQNSAIVVVKESGRNKFRDWTNQHVTYFLSKSSGNWKVVAFYIKDIKNPD